MNVESVFFKISAKSEEDRAALIAKCQQIARDAESTLKYWTYENGIEYSLYLDFFGPSFAINVVRQQFSGIREINVGSPDWKEYFHPGVVNVKVNPMTFDIEKILLKNLEFAIVAFSCMGDSIEFISRHPLAYVRKTLDQDLKTKNGIFFHAGKPYQIEYSNGF